MKDEGQMGKDMNDRVDQKIFYGWWVVASGFVLLFLFAGAGFYSFSIFIKPLEEHFGWSRSAISLAMSIYLLVHGVCGPFVGHLVETRGPKKVMTLFAVGTGAVFILISFTPSLWFFYGAYALLSIMTTGIGFIPVSSVLARWFVRRRGTAIGMAMVGISTGGLTMAPVIGMINAVYGWRLSFMVLGCLVWILALPITLFVVKGSPDDMGLTPDGNASGTSWNGPGEMDEQGWPWRPAFRSRAFFWIVLTFFLAPLGQMGVLQHQVPIIFEIGVSQAAAASALGFTAGLGGLGKLSFGWISERIPFRYTAMICFGLQAVGVLILFSADTLSMVWVHVLLFGFAMGGIVVLLPMVVSHFFGLPSFGVLMGTISFSQALGAASGAYLSGIIYDYSGSYDNALLFYIAVYLTSILTIFLAGKPRPYEGQRDPQRSP